jgi:hypothetical protein
MDQISLHKTSVAAYGYLMIEPRIPNNKVQHNVLELPLVLGLDLPCHICQQTLQDIDPLEIIYESCILGFAFLQQFVLVENCFERYVVLVEQTVDGRCIVEAKSAKAKERQKRRKVFY